MEEKRQGHFAPHLFKLEASNDLVFHLPANSEKPEYTGTEEPNSGRDGGSCRCLKTYQITPKEFFLKKSIPLNITPLKMSGIGFIFHLNLNNRD